MTPKPIRQLHRCRLCGGERTGEYPLIVKTIIEPPCRLCGGPLDFRGEIR